MTKPMTSRKIPSMHQDSNGEKLVPHVWKTGAAQLEAHQEYDVILKIMINTVFSLDLFHGLFFISSGYNLFR